MHVVSRVWATTWGFAYLKKTRRAVVAAEQARRIEKTVCKMAYLTLKLALKAAV
jgi:hypothetical protein